jgi:deoxyadenosine/deoxycytidine kinase
MKPILISLEGNIGSGKSTLLKQLREAEPNWIYIDEPVDFWMKTKNEKGQSLIEVFYQDIKRWSYTFQNAAVLSRGMLVQEALEKWMGTDKQPIFVMERCVETDKQIFAKMLHEDGMMDAMEWSLYEVWYKHITNLVPKINVYVWIDTPAEVCVDRIKMRGREGEEDIKREYLEKLERVHKEWLENERDAHIIRSTDLSEIRSEIHSYIQTQ